MVAGDDRRRWLCRAVLDAAIQQPGDQRVYLIVCKDKVAHGHDVLTHWLERELGTERQ